MDSSQSEYQVAKDRAGRVLTAASLVYDIVISELPAKTSWHVQRGPAEVGALAERLQPISRRLKTRSGVTLDSAQVLQASFHPIDGGSALQLYAHFFRGFDFFVSDKPRATGSRTITEVRALTTLLVEAAQALKQRPVSVMVLA